MASDAATRGVPCPAAGLPPRRPPATSGLDGTLSRIGANPVMRLGLRIDCAVRQRNVLVPIQHASILRPGATLPVRIDRADNRLLVVDWAALTGRPGAGPIEIHSLTLARVSDRDSTREAGGFGHARR